MTKHAQQVPHKGTAYALATGVSVPLALMAINMTPAHAIGRPPYNPYPSAADIKLAAETQQKLTPPPYNPYPSSSELPQDTSQDTIASGDDYYTPRDKPRRHTDGRTPSRNNPRPGDTILAQGGNTSNPGSIEYVDSAQPKKTTVSQKPHKKGDGMLTPEQIRDIDSILYNVTLTNDAKVSRVKEVASQPVRPPGYFVRSDAENMRIQQERQLEQQNQLYQSRELQSYNQGYTSPELQGYDQSSNNGDVSFQDYSAYGSQGSEGFTDAQRAQIAQQLRSEMGYQTTADSDIVVGDNSLASTLAGNNPYARETTGLTSSNPTAGGTYTTKRTDIPYVTRYEVFSICNNAKLNDAEKVARLKVLVNRPAGTGNTGVPEKDKAHRPTLLERIASFLGIGEKTPRNNGVTGITEWLSSIFTRGGHPTHTSPIRQGTSQRASIFDRLSSEGPVIHRSGIANDVKNSGLLDQVKSDSARHAASTTAVLQPTSDVEIQGVLNILSSLRAQQMISGITGHSAVNGGLVERTFLYDVPTGISTHLDTDVMNLATGDAGTALTNLLSLTRLVNDYRYVAMTESQRVSYIAQNFGIHDNPYMRLSERETYVSSVLAHDKLMLSNPQVMKEMTLLINRFLPTQPIGH